MARRSRSPVAVALGVLAILVGLAGVSVVARSLNSPVVRAPENRTRVPQRAEPAPERELAPDPVPTPPFEPVADAADAADFGCVWTEEWRARPTTGGTLPDKPLRDPPSPAVSIALALDWLARHQAPDGSWSSRRFSDVCRLNRCRGEGKTEHSLGVTSLALLAFLGDGQTHRSGMHKESVRRSLQYLMGVQIASGSFQSRETKGRPFDNTLAALALCEAYGMTGGRVFKRPAQSAVDFVCRVEIPALSGSEGFPSGPRDATLTAWIAGLLRSAKMCELAVDEAAVRQTVRWADQLTDSQTGRAFASGAKDQVASRVVATTTSAWVRLCAKGRARETPALVAPLQSLESNWPRWGVRGGEVDLSYWYFGSHVLVNFQKSDSRGWRRALYDAVLPTQHRNPQRDEFGSWDPVGARSSELGRVYATALTCLSLENMTIYGCGVHPR